MSFLEKRYSLEGEADAAALLVDADDHDAQDLADGDDFERVLDAPFRELGDVDEAVLVQADVNEGAEVRDVADRAVQNGAGLEL